jgi:hypothetical protein
MLKRSRRRISAAVLTCLAALAIGAAPQPASALGADSAAAPAAVPTTRAHDYPGAPKDTPRCNRLLRKIERARKQERYKRVNRLSARYNRTCRVK